LYVRALLDGMGLAGVPADPEIRSELNERAAQHGSPALHADLAKVDPETAARLHPNDAVRIVRALEVFRLTGLTLSAWIERDRTTRAPIPALRVGLTMRRPELDRRIDARVDAMMSAGLRDEVAVLLARGAQPGRGVMRGLGYSEMCDHLSGTLALDEAVSTIKSNTRRFARRQLTWFRPDRSIHWLDVTGMVASEVADRICDQAGRVDAPLSAERGSSTEHG
ncbi:MAG: tRNA (adenosine(37)-N6)-dimethylallyltransferase MiaA, partial [Armatimonadetes bacterium]|nr:tRNA (adenosine(37)-N6)-dimethylallyltransferase MiaA [Armatimonadota bacterium]